MGRRSEPRNVCRMQLRHRREGVRKVALESVEHLISREQDLTEAAADVPTTAESLQRLRKQAIHKAMARLPDIERDAIVLCLLEGRNTTETAQALSVSEAATRSILLRATNRLKRMKEIRELLPEWMGWN